MNRRKLEDFIKKNYNTDADYPWFKFPDYAVFRHLENKKWFAIIMSIEKNKIGLEGKDIINIVNLKCKPELIGSFLSLEGIFPAYHMSKAHWISVLLDGSVEFEMIKTLLDMSYENTYSKKYKK